MENKMLIVARYEEDISWTNKWLNSGWAVRVINKSNGGEIENVGREPHSYLYFIVNNYKSLPNIMIFSQGNPYHHLSNFDDFIKIESIDGNGFIWLGPTLVCQKNGAPHHYGLDIENFYKEAGFGYCPEQISFKPNCIFIVTKEVIQKRHLTFYKKLLEMSKEGLNPWILERLWGTIFGV